MSGAARRRRRLYEGCREVHLPGGSQRLRWPVVVRPGWALKNELIHEEYIEDVLRSFRRLTKWLFHQGKKASSLRWFDDREAEAGLDSASMTCSTTACSRADGKRGPLHSVQRSEL